MWRWRGDRQRYFRNLKGCKADAGVEPRREKGAQIHGPVSEDAKKETAQLRCAWRRDNP